MSCKNPVDISYENYDFQTRDRTFAHVQLMSVYTFKIALRIFAEIFAEIEYDS